VESAVPPAAIHVEKTKRERNAALEMFVPVATPPNPAALLIPSRLPSGESKSSIMCSIAKMNSGVRIRERVVRLGLV
jgi:hypothetical protein